LLPGTGGSEPNLDVGKALADSPLVLHEGSRRFIRYVIRQHEGGRSFMASSVMASPRVKLCTLAPTRRRRDLDGSGLD
jgi:hypothetical protein